MEIVGGMDFLIDLAGMMGTAANVVYHAGIVREKAVLRSLITVSTTIAAEAFEGGRRRGQHPGPRPGAHLRHQRGYPRRRIRRRRPDRAGHLQVHRRSLPEQRRRDRPAHRLFGAGPQDRRPAEIRSRRPGRPPVHGQDQLGPEPGLQRGRQRERGRGHLQPGNGARAAGDAHARQQRLVQSAQPETRQAAGRGLAAADPGLRAADPGAHLHRRQQRHLGPGNEGQGAAAQAAAWAGADHHRLPSADELARAGSRTGSRKSRPSAGTSRAWPRT